MTRHLSNTLDESSMLSSSTRRTSVSSNHSFANRLSSSGVVEIELQQWISALLHAEEEATKHTKPQRFTSLLADIKEIKLSADVMLKTAEIQITRDGRVVPIGGQEYYEASLSSSVAVKHLARRESTMMSNNSLNNSLNNNSHRSARNPSLEPIDPDSIPETLIEEERQSCKAAIQVFGEEVVACVLSVKVKCRERGLTWVAMNIKKAFTLAQEENLDKLRKDASLIMIQEAVMDSRESILNMGIAIWQDLNDFCSEALVPPRMVYGLIERAFSALLVRTGDSNPRIRLPATRLVLTLAEKYSDPPYSLLSLFICKPERIIHNYREAKARIELVTAATQELKIMSEDPDDSYIAIIQLSDLMNLVVAYMGHSNEEVREAVVELIILASDQVGFSSVKRFLNNDLLLSLEDSFKQLSDPQRGSGTTAVSAAILYKEIFATSAALQAEEEEEEEAAAAASAAASTRPATSRATASSKSNIRSQEKLEPEIVVESSACIFCDEVDPEFNEDTLISHYYNSCPVLTNCPMCSIILEVSTYNDHIFSDCEQRHLVKQCGRCRQAVPVEQWLNHTLKQTCIGK
ncbi:hypothetical protein F4703DRAFT_1730073 [Phycomyces blakesleeanus]